MELKTLSNNTKRLLKFIDEEHRKYIEDFYILNQNEENYSNININEIPNNNYLYTNEEMNLLLEYSGWNYKHINNALRDTWNYEENGHIDKKREYLDIGNEISEIIMNKPTNLGNIKTYRGVNLSYFREYGIENIEDLTNLKGTFILDNGFVSTSINEDKCFFKSDNDLGMNYNVKITYLIPEELNDGILLSGNLSYSPNQEEFLINTSNIALVKDVIINDDNTACITAMIIPKMIYDDYYAYLNSNKTR